MESAEHESETPVSSEPSSVPSGGAAAQATSPASSADAPPEPGPDTAAEVPAGPAPFEDDEGGAVQDSHEDHQRAVELDLEELVARAEKADAYLELAQRTKADYENYRKRASREAAAAQERGVIKLARELLPAVDNLDRALAAAHVAPGEGGDAADTLVSGVQLVHADVIAALARVGIEPFSPEGELFDPQLHEAVAQQPVDGTATGTIVEVFQRGYRLGETVLRPARVVVAG